MTSNPPHATGIPSVSSCLEASETESPTATYAPRRSVTQRSSGPSPLDPLLDRLDDDEIREPSSLSISFRHSGWIPTRRRIAAALYRTQQSFARTESFASCGRHAYVLRNTDDPNTYRIAGSACHDRFCLPCATERSCIMAANVHELVQSKQIRFLTLTIKTDELNLFQSLNKLYTSFQALRRRSLWLDAVTGGVAFLELVYNHDRRRWHPHFHCLIEGTWLDQALLKTAWNQITGDSFIVDIRRPANNDTVCRYVTKYASKPFNNTFVAHGRLLDEAIVQLKGRKLAVTFGSWRGKLLTVNDTTGSWEHVAPLADLIQKAANGDDICKDILSRLTDADLTTLYSRAPPPQNTTRTPPPHEIQLDWMGTWAADGTFKYRNGSREFTG